MDSLRKYILCYVFFNDCVYMRGNLKVPGDVATQKPEGVHSRHRVVENREGGVKGSSPKVHCPLQSLAGSAPSCSDCSTSHLEADSSSF